MKWCIYYDDGSTFSSDQGDPKAAPLDGVLCIAQERIDGKVQIIRGPDYYYWLGDSWAGGSIADLERWLRRDMPLLKYGRWVLDKTWDEVRKRAWREWLG